MLLCGYDKDKNKISNTYYKIFSDIKIPEFINYEFTNVSNANLSNYKIEEETEYNKRIKYNKLFI